MLHALAYAVACVMTAVALWRLPAVIHGDTYRRALWGCYAGFAAALWLKTPYVVYKLNHGPVTDGSILLKHYVSTAAILAILTFVAASYGRYDGAEVPKHVAVSRWIQRVAMKTSLGAMALMTLLFFTVVNRSHPSTDFVAEHAGQWGATAYMSVFYLYLGAASAICCYQWVSALVRAERRALRVGLILMATAMVLGVTYVAIRVTWMWTALAHPVSAHLDHELGDATEYLQIALFFLFAAGASVPTASAVGTRANAWRGLREIYPLWAKLMTSLPGISFAPPAPRRRELLRLSPPLTTRLDRWTQDVADAVEQLRHYAPPYLLEAAEEATAQHDDPPAACEAAWINAALAAVAADERRAEASEALPTKPIADGDAEAEWLRRVTAAFNGLTTEDAQYLLKAARESA